MVPSYGGTGFLRSGTRRRITQEEIDQQRALNALLLSQPPGSALDPIYPPGHSRLPDFGGMYLDRPQSPMIGAAGPGMPVPPSPLAPRPPQVAPPARGTAFTRPPVIQAPGYGVPPMGLRPAGPTPPAVDEPPMPSFNEQNGLPRDGVDEIPPPVFSPVLSAESLPPPNAQTVTNPALATTPEGALQQTQPQAKEEPGLFDRMFSQAGSEGSPMSLALLSAGLGILANNYGHYGQAGPAIGKGALQGLQTYMSERDRIAKGKLQEQKMAMDKAQHDAYLRQVSAQEQKTRQADAQDTRLQAAYREYLATPDGDPKKRQLLNLIVMYQGKANELIKEETAKSKVNHQITDLAATDENGGPLIDPVTKQHLVQKWVIDKTTGQKIMPLETPKLPRSGLTIQNLPSNEAAKVLAVEAGKHVEGRRQEAVGAREMANQFKLLNDVLGDYQGGAFDQLLANVGRVVPLEGLKDIATTDQLAKSIQLKAANAFKMPGAVSNYEQQTYLAAVPSLLWYKEGRQVAADMADKLAARKSKLSGYEAKMLRENGYVDQEALDAFDQSLGPIFTDEERQKLHGAAKGKANTMGAQRPRSPSSFQPKPQSTPGPVAPPGAYYVQ